MFKIIFPIENYTTNVSYTTDYLCIFRKYIFTHILVSISKKLHKILILLVGGDEFHVTSFLTTWISNFVRKVLYRLTKLVKYSYILSRIILDICIVFHSNLGTDSNFTGLFLLTVLTPAHSTFGFFILIYFLPFMWGTLVSNIFREDMWLVCLPWNGFLLLLSSQNSLAEYYMLWSQSFTFFSPLSKLGGHYFNVFWNLLKQRKILLST